MLFALTIGFGEKNDNTQGEKKNDERHWRDNVEKKTIAVRFFCSIQMDVEQKSSVECLPKLRLLRKTSKTPE
jgi:hypothetical protein